MYETAFTIYTMPLTLNQVISKHWRHRHTNFKKIHSEIAVQLIGKIPETPIKKAKIFLTRFSSGSLDRDNSYFTCKPILDSLVELRVLENDTWENVEQPHITQVKVKRGDARKVKVLVVEA